MLRKVKVGALAATIVVLAGAFGLDIPRDTAQELVAIISGIVSIGTYAVTAWGVRERQANLDKLKTK